MPQAILGEKLHRHPKHRVKSLTNEQETKHFGSFHFAALEFTIGGFINGTAQEDSLYSLHHSLAFQNSTLHKTFPSPPTLYFQFKNILFKRNEEK